MGGARWRGLRVRKVLRDPKAEGTSRAAPEGLCPQGEEDASRLEPEDRDPQSLCKASDRGRARLARPLATLRGQSKWAHARGVTGAQAAGMR